MSIITYRPSPRSSGNSMRQYDIMTSTPDPELEAVDLDPKDLFQRLLQLTQERDKLKEDIKIYSAENASLKQQLSLSSSTNRRYMQQKSQTQSEIQLQSPQSRQLYSRSRSRSLTQRQMMARKIFPFSSSTLKYQSQRNENEVAGILKSRSVDHEELEDECDVDTDEYYDDQDQNIAYLLPADLRGENETEHHNTISVILSQSMTVLANINNQQVIEKVCAGSLIARQLLVGNFVGYFASYLVRRFGKIAAGSIIGSVCLVKLAHHRGYIAVDWSRIQNQIDCSTIPAGKVGADDSGFSIEDDLAWVTSKIQQARNWAHENTYSVLGFCTGFFLYNVHR